MAANKIKYGLKNVYYSVITEGSSGISFGTPKAIPGAVSLTLDAEGDVSKFKADNIDYYVDYANNGYSGSLEVAIIPDSFKTDCLGMKIDDNGLLVESAGDMAKSFALLFQFEGDQKALRHVFYNCKAGRPGTGSETKGDTIEPRTDELELTASALPGTEYVKASTTETTDATTYNGWFTSVQEPDFTPPSP